MNNDYSAFTKKIEINPVAPQLKVNDRVRSTKHNSILSKSYTENMSREISIMDSVLKTNPWN